MLQKLRIIISSPHSKGFTLSIVLRKLLDIISSPHSKRFALSSVLRKLLIRISSTHSKWFTLSNVLRKLLIRISSTHSKWFCASKRSAETANSHSKWFCVLLHFLYRKTHVSSRFVRGGRAISQWIRNWNPHAGFPTEHQEGSARVPRDAPSQFVRQTCFPKRKSDAERNGAELQSSTKAVPYTPNYCILPNSRSPPHGAATRNLLLSRTS